MIEVGSFSSTVWTVPASVGAVPPFAAVRSAMKLLRVPEPVCGISGMMASVDVPPGTWFQVVYTPV